MGTIVTHDPAMLVVAAFSAFSDALEWAHAQLPNRYGPIALESPRFAFQETDYYESTMGRDLQKQFFAFDILIDPAQLPAIKHQTNALEQAYAKQGLHPVPRPLNLDPGYLTLGKLVLASTKDHAHRVYVGDGIFAEVTLRYEAGRFVPWPWTYPDYRRDDYHAFFLQVRAAYRQRLGGGH